MSTNEEIVFKLIIILLVMNNVCANDTTVANSFEKLSKTQDKWFENYLKHFYLYEKIEYWYGNSREAHSKAKMVFKSNLVLNDYFNTKYTTAKFAINRYTGITFDKFIQEYTGFNGTSLIDEDVVEFDPEYVEHIPVMMDWRQLLSLYIMNSCKNSYVYSALSNIEARYFAFTGVMNELSVRQAFECEDFGNCRIGGVPHNVFTALQNTGGLSYSYQYPDFEDINNITKNECATKTHRVEIQVTGFIRFKVKKESDLIPLLSTYGPVSTTIFVSESLKNYREGVYDPDDCGTNATNHAVLLAGYGYDTVLKLPFWRVLTAWGGDWGERGYFRLKRGNHICNFAREYIATAIVQPAKGGSLTANNIAMRVATAKSSSQNLTTNSIYPFQIS